jgi:hypothetical protein
MLRDADGVVHTLHVYDPESVLPATLVSELQRFLLLPDREQALDRFGLVSCFLNEWRNRILDGYTALASIDEVDCTEALDSLDVQARQEGSKCLSKILELSAKNSRTELDVLEMVDEIIDDWHELYLKHTTCLGHVLLEHDPAVSFIDLSHDALLVSHARMHNLARQRSRRRGT